MNIFPRNVTIRVEFDALRDLVAYLRENQQAQIDAVTAKVNALTGRLGTSAHKLQQAADAEQESV